MFQKISKHRANDAYLTMHRPPLAAGVAANLGWVVVFRTLGLVHKN